MRCSRMYGKAVAAFRRECDVINGDILIALHGDGFRSFRRKQIESLRVMSDVGTSFLPVNHAPTHHEPPVHSVR